MRNSKTKDRRADLRSVRQDILVQLHEREARTIPEATSEKPAPFPARYCSVSILHGPPRWYRDLVGYCDACWHRLGFYDPWKHDQAGIVAEEVMAAAHTRKIATGPGMPPWYDQAVPDYNNLLDHLKGMYGQDYDAAGEIAERRAIWQEQQNGGEA